VIEWIVNAKRAAILTSIRERLNKPTLGEEVSSDAPATEKRVKHACVCIHKLAAANWQIVDPVHSQPVRHIICGDLIIEVELLGSNIGIVVIRAIVGAVVTVS